MDVLDHEMLDVYQCSIQLLTIALRLAGRLPRGETEIRDQLKRAATSIPLNIAEGVGKPTSLEKARFHGIARGSALECAAILDVCRVAGLASPSDVDQGKALLTRIVAMLTKMCRV